MSMRLQATYSKIDGTTRGSIQLRKADSLLQITEPLVQEISLEWKGLDVVVPAQTRCFGRKLVQEEKYILRGVSGSVAPGSLVGIMGESGCGKTTLLQALTRELSPSLDTLGSITLNKVEAGNRLPNSCAYVPQFDDFPPCLTVTEHLYFQALLRLGRAYTALAKEGKVANILEELNLLKVRHSRIGSKNGARGISGGELKRLSVAQELLVDPSLIILDEPTSGLDTFMSEQLVSTLKHLTLKGRSVLCTIHQPSADTFDLFDRVVLMRKGLVVYEGKPEEGVESFTRAGAAGPIEGNMNPADYLLHALATESDPVLEVLSRVRNDETPAAIPVSGVEYIMLQQSRAKARLYSVWQEISVLSRREGMNYKRKKSQFKTKLTELAVVPVLLGVLYWQLDDTFQYVQSKLGLMFLMLFYWNYSCYISVMPVELQDRGAYKREIRSSMYCPTSWIVSKSLVRLPFETIYTFLFITVIYWMAGLDSSRVSYFTFLFAGWLSAECAVSFGYLTSAITPTFKVAMAVHIAIILPLFITAGLFINAATVPWYLVWCKWISFYYYAFEMMCATQFTGDAPFPGCEASRCPLNSGQEVLSSLAFHSDNIWKIDVPVLIVLLLAYRGLALFVIYRRSK